MKAILVIDMPNHCSKCPCWDRDYPVCCVLNKENKSKDYGHRPKWCPLKPMPQKVDEISVEETMIMKYGKETIILEKAIKKARQQGYNLCVDEILGEE